MRTGVKLPGITKMHHIDLHTEGEPTRVILSGGSDLDEGALKQRRECFAELHDDWRTAIVAEPRGAEVMVGTLLRAPADPNSATGGIFFNDGSYLGMCGHTTMGLAASLHHAGRMSLGKHLIETSVGTVSVNLQTANRVRLENVASYRHRKSVSIGVAGPGL